MEKKEKWIKRSVLGSMAALAVMAVVGCAEEITQQFTDRTEVQVTASFSDTGRESLTRAADGLDNSTAGFSLTTSESSSSKVRVMVDANDGTYSPFDYSITNATTMTAPATPPSFPSGVNSVNVYGWYPNVSLTNFSVNANQQSEANYCLSDLMVAAGSTCTRSGSSVTQSANLSFTHVMSKVKVSLTLASGVTVTAVKLKSILPQVTVTEQKTSNAVTSFNLGEASGSATDITLFSGSLTSASAAADKVLCGVFPPQSKNGAFLEINASYNSGAAQTITYSFGSAKAFARANEYTMNITLNGTNVTTGTVDISDWNVESGTVEITPGGGSGGSLELDKSTMTLVYGGNTGSLTISGSVTLSGSGTTSFSAISSNTSVATVAVSGSTITVTPAANGASTGTTTVTVTDGNNNENTATCLVTVNKPAGALLSAVTSGHVGYAVGQNGRVYATLDALNTDNTTCVGVLAYSGSTGHGLICALVNATNQTWNTINGWSNQTTQGFTGKKLPDAAARGTLASYTTLGSTTVSDWMVLSKDDYTTMWNAFGNASNGTYNGTSNGYITAAGGTACSGDYWSTTEYYDYDAWTFRSNGWYGSYYYKTNSYGVRPVLAF